MVSMQHLSKAPIAEAVIDFRCVLPSEVDTVHLNEIAANIEEEYPIVETQMVARGRFNISDGEDPSFQDVSRVVHGLLCKSEEHNNIVQFRRDGFTFSELPPYSDWDSFSQKAKRFWEIYKNKLQPEIIRRVAVRYINHIEVPLVPTFQFENYLTAYPIIPESLPQTISDFLSRVTITDADNAIMAHVTQSLLQDGANEGKITLLLDIDAFQEIPEDTQLENGWDLLPLLRKFKNDIFFNYITENTLELLR